MPRGLAKNKKAEIAAGLKKLEKEAQEKRRARVDCPVCGKMMRGYTNLARHMTRTAEMYVQHVDYVERFTGRNFTLYAIGGGGQKMLAELLLERLS